MEIKINIDSLKEQYEESGKEALLMAVEAKKKGIAYHVLLPYANEITIDHLKKLESQMDDLLRECESLTQLMEILWKMFSSIPGINMSAVNNYAILYSYVHDFDNDADCESMISKPASELLIDSGVDVNSLVASLTKMGKESYAKKAVAYFLNEFVH